MSLIDWLRGRRGGDARPDEPSPETYELIRQMREQAQKAKAQEFMIRREVTRATWLEEALTPRRNDEARDRRHESQ